MIYEPSCLNILYATIYYICISNCGFSFDLDVSSDSVKVSLRSEFTFNKFIYLFKLLWIIKNNFRQV